MLLLLNMTHDRRAVFCGLVRKLTLISGSFRVRNGESCHPESLRIATFAAPSASLCSNSALVSLSIHFPSALRSHNGSEYYRTQKSPQHLCWESETTLWKRTRKKKKKAEVRQIFSRRTIYLSLRGAIKSWGEPEEMAVMTDKAPSWGELQNIWALLSSHGDILSGKP